MAEPLDIRSFALGHWLTNCYVVHPHAARDGQGAPCAIIDAGFEPDAMIAYIRARGLKPTVVVLTHAHLDHIAGLDIVRGAFPGVATLIHPAEADFLTRPELNLSISLDEPVIVAPATGTVEEGQTLTLADAEFEVRATPGHSPGGITLYQAERGLAFVGDTLFAGSVGRTDFPTSNPDGLFRGIRDQLLTLPDATRVFPGHGRTTTIGAERASNPYLQRLAAR